MQDLFHDRENSQLVIHHGVMSGWVALQCAEVVRAPQLDTQSLKDFPVSIAALGAELACKMRSEIVVEKRIVDIDRNTTSSAPVMLTSCQSQGCASFRLRR